MVFDESESGNRQLPELPTYVVENWSGQRQVISSSGIGRTSSDDGEIALTSIGVHHTNEEAAITVTSHRPARQWNRGTPSVVGPQRQSGWDARRRRR